MTVRRTTSLLLLALSACSSHAPVADLPAEWTEPATRMEFVLVEPGAFEMGSLTPDTLRPAPRHPVGISAPFYLGRFEVTRAEWRQVMGNDPSQYVECERCPVESVSWHDVQQFLVALSAVSPGESYRLPTEAEWEFACRADGQGRFGAVDLLTPEMANFDARIPFEGRVDSIWIGHPTPVGSYPANAFGLHDMSGNAWEWTEDEFCPYPTPSLEAVRVGQDARRCGTDTIAIRGGSWYFSANAARCGRRYTHARTDSGFSLGFRVVREVS